MEGKTCRCCDEWKILDDYYSDKTGVGGVRGSCKECVLRSERVKRQRDLPRSRAYGRSYYEENRGRLLKAANDNQKTPRGRIDNAVSSGIQRGIRKGSKNGRRSFDLVGYTLERLVAHLERQFEPWMTWENYGFYGWHIDHIRPLASFNYSSPDDPEFKLAWALSNLRPLGAVENWRKGYTDMPEPYEATDGTPADTKSKSAA